MHLSSHRTLQSSLSFLILALSFLIASCDQKSDTHQKSVKNKQSPSLLDEVTQNATQKIGDITHREINKSLATGTNILKKVTSKKTADAAATSLTPIVSTLQGINIQSILQYLPDFIRQELKKVAISLEQEIIRLEHQHMYNSDSLRAICKELRPIIKQLK
ncbi:MAG: hypothetical protein RSE01_03280 [Akkermansia sp.]